MFSIDLSYFNFDLETAASACEDLEQLSDQPKMTSEGKNMKLMKDIYNSNGCELKVGADSSVAASDVHVENSGNRRSTIKLTEPPTITNPEVFGSSVLKSKDFRFSSFDSGPRATGQMRVLGRKPLSKGARSTLLRTK